MRYFFYLLLWRVLDTLLHWFICVGPKLSTRFFRNQNWKPFLNPLLGSLGVKTSGDPWQALVPTVDFCQGESIDPQWFARDISYIDPFGEQDFWPKNPVPINSVFSPGWTGIKKFLDCTSILFAIHNSFPSPGHFSGKYIAWIEICSP